jgi:hypothetical protein
MAEGIFYKFALPDDPFLDRFLCGYERTDCYFRGREWFKGTSKFKVFTSL